MPEHDQRDPLPHVFIVPDEDQFGTGPDHPEQENRQQQRSQRADRGIRRARRPRRPIAVHGATLREARATTTDEIAARSL